MSNILEKNEGLEKAIFNFAWDRLDTIDEGKIEGIKEAEKSIDDAMKEIKNILIDSKVENIVKILANITDAYQYKSNLLIEKAYRTGMADGLKLVNNL